MTITEGTQPAPVQVTGTTGTTAPFVPEAGALLIFLVAADGANVTSATTVVVTDSLGGTWTLLKRQNTFVQGPPDVGGSAEVWVRDSPGVSMTVTGTWTSTNGGPDGEIVVRTLIGALPTAQQTGATGGTGGVSVAPSVTLTPTKIGSRIYGAGLRWVDNASLTANAQTTTIDQFNDATVGDTWAAFKSNADTTSLTSTTYGWTNANSAYNVAAAEILAASTAGGFIQSGFHPGLGPTNARFYQPPRSLDAITAATPITLADSGIGDDSGFTVAAAVPLADSGTGSDALSVSAAVPLADSGTGTDALSISAAVPLADSGAGSDALAVVQQISLADSGTGTDSLTVGLAVALADSGAGTDTLAVSAAVPLAETGTGSGTLTVTAAVPLAETGSGTEALAVTAAVPLAETGAGTDALATGIAVALADAGTGSDALAVVHGIALAETGAGSDTLAVAAAVGLAETGSGAELLGVAASVALVEAGAGADTFVTIQGAVNQPGTVTATDASQGSARVSDVAGAVRAADLATGAARSGDVSGSMTMGDKPTGGETGGTRP